MLSRIKCFPTTSQLPCRKTTFSSDATIKTSLAKTKSFESAMAAISSKINEGTDSDWGFLALRTYPFNNCNVRQSLFPFEPLHWAVVALGTPEGDLQGLTEEDVKLIYKNDPKALQRYCFTPVHFHCVIPPTRNRMSLLRYFYTCDKDCFTREYDHPEDFGNIMPSLLHLAYEAGQPTEELLRFLLQLDPSQVKKEDRYCTPLECLCKNDCCNEKLMSCLLEFNSSAETVGKSIKVCLDHSKGYPSALEKIDILLKANPEAAKYKDDTNWDIQDNLLHYAIESDLHRDPALCIKIMQRILVVHPDAVKESDECIGGDLPVHYSARRSTLEVMEFLLSLYPASATILGDQTIPYGSDDDDDDDENDDSNTYGDNLLHLSVHGPYRPNYNWGLKKPGEKAIEIIDAKVRFLCSNYPEMMSQRDDDGNTISCSFKGLWLHAWKSCI